MKKVAVIDYGMGNLMSVWRAWQHAGADAKIISSPTEMSGADVLVFPGQGCIIDTIKLLKQTGFDNAIREWIAQDKPFFGICLGLQALFEYSEEGDVDCLGIFKGSVKRLRLPHQYKVPHMGWNQLNVVKECPILEGIDKEYFYFVHSYYAIPDDSEIIAGTCDYGIDVTAALSRNNLFSTQFHPEKSGEPGLKILKNFVNIKE